MNPKDLEDIRELLRGLEFNLNRMLQADYASYGITLLQGRLLSAVKLEGDMPIGRLADLMNMTPSNVSIICKRLEKMEYLSRSRCAQDARVVRVSLTEKGANILKNIHLSQKKRFESTGYATQKENLEIIKNGLIRLNQMFEDTVEQKIQEEKYD